LLISTKADRIIFKTREATTGTEMLMPKSHEAVLWVVYQMNIDGKTAGRNAVCEQAEWDAMELAHPGQHVLVRSGIPSESEAERLARGTSGDAKVHLPHRS
jgi:hypothetical protein